ncbi:MAG: response regulator, partial [Gammaproteobacteria bacterium]|nr:response regulator [Gammaproteobacteria bacterium]
ITLEVAEDGDQVQEVSEQVSAEDEMFLDAISGNAEDEITLEVADDSDEVLEVDTDLSLEDEISLDIDGESLESIEISDLDGEAPHDDLEEVSLLVTEDTIDEPDSALEIAGADEEMMLEEPGENDFVVEIDESDELDVEETTGLQMDPMLFQIYYDESCGHLQSLKDMLAAHESGRQKLEANKDLIRALHTLFGSARTAEIEAIAEISGATEKYVMAREDADDLLIPDDVVGVIAEVVSNVEAMLAELKSDRMPVSNKHLLETINKATQDELQRQLQQPPSSTKLSVEEVEDEGLPDEEMQSEPAAEKEEALYTYGDVDDDLIDIFLEEAEELLEDCETTLTKLHENEEDTASINELQRHMHTLKGGARMATLVPVGDLTHELESMVIMLAEHKIEPGKDFFDVLHESLDTLNNMLELVKQRQALKPVGDLISRIIAIMRGEVIEQRAVERFDVEVEDLQVEEEPEEEVVDEQVSVEQQQPATTAEVVELEPVKAAEPPKRRKSDVEQEKPHWGERATDVNFKDSQEQVRVRADLLNNLVNYAGEVNIHHARMGKQMTDIGFNLKELNQTVIRLKEQLRKLEIETEIQIRSSYEKEADDFDENFDPLEMDRYSTLQQLAKSLNETASDVDSIKDILAEIVTDSETLLLQESRISTDLQEGLMRTRMVRFGGMSTRLRRIIRQTARELGKEVNVEIVGEEQEVDRTILDRVVAPLEHMLRNAVAHGIELPKDRLESGKAEAGLIRITVGRQGTDVVVKVEDDGGGINADAIRKKAIKQGLLEADSELTDHDVLQFILKSGFSTAEEVTQVAGRGVGMDVVDSEIKQLGGVLEIDTERGKGTTFRVRLPLTLAINQALLVDTGDDVYAVPLASIEGVVRITGTELQGFYDSNELEYEFNNINYELKHLGFLLTGQQPNYADQGQLFPVLLVHVGDQHFALHVDDLLGRHEIVVKPVGVQISSVRGIAGATILADGRVVLILEMSALVIGESLFKEIVTEEAVEEPEVETEPTIMVVDDSITIRKVTARILERHGMKVLLATDGVDATNKLQEEIPDLMLLDIEMPRMDGFELATYMRNEERLKDIPIIMITSRTGTKHKERAKSIGVEQYLGKPYQEEELMKNINALLELA